MVYNETTDLSISDSDNTSTIECTNTNNININKVILQGTVKNTPILRQDKKGTTVTNFGLITVESVKNKETSANIIKKHNIVAWGDLAKKCCEDIKKDMTIYIEGSLNYISKSGTHSTEIKLTYLNNGQQNIIASNENDIIVIEN